MNPYEPPKSTDSPGSPERTGQPLLLAIILIISSFMLFVVLSSA